MPSSRRRRAPLRLLGRLLGPGGRSPAVALVDRVYASLQLLARLGGQISGRPEALAGVGQAASFRRTEPHLTTSPGR